MSRTDWIPYSRQQLDEDDIEAVVAALRSDFLTTGPRVGEFEAAFAAFVGAREAVAVSSGTAALHCACHAAGLGPGDEVLVPCLTFTATASAVLHCGATPVFVDVDPDTLLVDPESARSRITSRTRALIAVDFAGQPCDYPALHTLAEAHGLRLIADGCHALGAALGEQPVGVLADCTAFSLHPVKPATCGEGGVVTTHDPDVAERMRRFRNHGIDRDHRARANWKYEVREAGFNYRLTDFQCALAASQLGKVEARRRRREEIAGRYHEAFRNLGRLRSLAVLPDRRHAWHLFVVRIDFEALGRSREELFEDFAGLGVGVNVHYLPVHLHPLYRDRCGTGPGLCPAAERVYEEILSLPLFGSMSDAEVERVIRAVESLLGGS